MSILARYRLPALVLGLLATVSCIAALFLKIDRTLFFRAYLFAYLFCLGLALGSLVLLMLHTLTGGAWGVRIGPIARAAARTIPLLALLFVPICFGLRWLYPWARPEELLHNGLLMHRQPYLNPTFFVIRAIVYFVIWIALAIPLSGVRPPSRALSAGGLILYLFTMTHAGTDWIMSRDTDFYSTAFGFILTVGQTLSAFAFAVAILPAFPPLAPRAPKRGTERPPLLNDLGNLLLTLVILWAYVSFMQFLVIWMGNTREDNTWYLERGLGGGGDATAWQLVGVTLILFQFFVPFYVLLFRKAKQNSAALTAIAGLLLAAHALETYWLVAPSGHEAVARFDPHWLDLAAFLALTSLWFSAFVFLLQRSGPAVEPPHPALQEGVPGHE